MPPPGSPRPAQTAIKAATTGIEAEFERADKRDASNPGRVTARRLNRERVERNADAVKNLGRIEQIFEQLVLAVRGRD